MRRRFRRNADPRLRSLERALAESPNDVELQHALMIAKVRAGELPEYAVDRLIPGRPVQPWQWVPASYVLLEAEWLGRSTEWQEGKVEIEWSVPLIPLMGADDRRAMEEREFQETTPSGERVIHPSYHLSVHAGYHSKVYVGSRSVGWDSLQRVANSSFGELRDVQSPEYFEYVLSVIPPRWIPGLTDVEGWGAPIRLGTIPISYADRLAPEQSSKIRSPDDYGGVMPDAHEPQQLLFASGRVVRTGRRRRGEPSPDRTLQQTGPLLDVRLINRVRIMKRRGKRWV